MKNSKFEFQFNFKYLADFLVVSNYVISVGLLTSEKRFTARQLTGNLNLHVNIQNVSLQIEAESGIKRN